LAQADATQASAEQAVLSVYHQVQARHATDAAPEPHGRRAATNRSSESMVSMSRMRGAYGCALLAALHRF
jgi:hypothetical protein